MSVKQVHLFLFQGIFRLACEHTLRVMRRGGETLLTLLEAFVYDPLVDWRAGAENSIATYGACQARARCTGVGRKQLEIELTAAMFAVRIAEMRAEWLANKEELTKCFPTLCHRLTRYVALFYRRDEGIRGSVLPTELLFVVKVDRGLRGIETVSGVSAG